MWHFPKDLSQHQRSRGTALFPLERLHKSPAGYRHLLLVFVPFLLLLYRYLCGWQPAETVRYYTPTVTLGGMSILDWWRHKWEESSGLKRSCCHVLAAHFRAEQRKLEQCFAWSLQNLQSGSLSHLMNEKHPNMIFDDLPFCVKYVVSCTFVFWLWASLAPQGVGSPLCICLIFRECSDSDWGLKCRQKQE